jgi:hypothetical protein
MKVFEQLVLESLVGEYKIILWCSWFSLLNDEYKRRVVQIFEMIARPHPNGFIYGFHIKGNAEMFKDVKVEYEMDEERGPKITLSNIRVINRNVVQFLMEEIIHRTFGDMLRANRLIPYLETVVKVPIPGTRIFKVPAIDGKIIDLYGDVKERLPELEGVF